MIRRHLLPSLAIAAFVAGVGFHAGAKPAKPGVLEVTASDGSILRVRLSGDERFHQYFTEDGYPLIEIDGAFHYCDFDSDGNVEDSGIKAGDISLRTQPALDFLAKVDKASLEDRIRKRARKARRVIREADGAPFDKGPGLFPDIHFPSYGQQKAIVILVEFRDVRFNSSYDPKEYFTKMLNEDGFSDPVYGGTGSAAQYFRENSMGVFEPEFDVYGPVRVSRDMAYYGSNDRNGNDEHIGDLVKEACDKLDSTVDFSQYDRDGDGVIDNIFIFYAGYGEATGGGPDTIWPHAFNMTDLGFPALMYDGVMLYTYGCSNEWEGSPSTPGRPDGVCTFVHEFSHVMGLPDLYSTTNTGAFTPGSWSILDQGSYNNDGITPPNYGAFERYALGWVKPREIDRPLNATLQPIAENACGIIRTHRDNEFFLLENRQKVGWDLYIPHHGMLIWHIDYDEKSWSDNTVNNAQGHQGVDIVEADGTQSEASRTGDAFPGNARVTEFTPSTNPAMKAWDGTEINYPITEITESNRLITFKVLGGAEPMRPLETYEASNVRANSFTLSWEAPAEGNEALLSVYTKEGDTRRYLAGYQSRAMGSAATADISGVEPVTTYYFEVAQTNGWETSETSGERQLTTTPYTIDYFAVEALEATDIKADSFTARWNALEQASSYSLSVYTKRLGQPFQEKNGFDDGVAGLSDWTVSSSVTTYGMASYAGEAIPSLRLPDGASLTTPAYDDFINELEFWHRGNSTSDEDMVEIYAVTTDGTRLIHSLPAVRDAGGATTVLKDEIPPRTLQIRIAFRRLSEKGQLALDDVRIGHGHEFEAEYLDGYYSLEAGSGLTHTVSGLKSSTSYFYIVTATDGTLSSLPSKEMEVVTADESGVDSVFADNAVKVEGRVITGPKDMTVYTAAGVLSARGARVVLTAPGLYLINVPSQHKTIKTIIK